MATFLIDILGNTLRVSNIEKEGLVDEVMLPDPIIILKYLYNTQWKCKDDGKIYIALIGVLYFRYPDHMRVYKIENSGRIHFVYEKSNFTMANCNNQLVSDGKLIEWLHEDRKNHDDIATLSVIDSFTGTIIDDFTYNCFCAPIPDSVTFLYPGIYAINDTCSINDRPHKYCEFECYSDDEKFKMIDSKKMENFKYVYPIWSYNSIIFGKNYETNRLIFFDIYHFDFIMDLDLSNVVEIHYTDYGSILLGYDDKKTCLFHLDTMTVENITEFHSGSNLSHVMIKYLLSLKSIVYNIPMPRVLNEIIKSYAIPSVLISRATECYDYI